MTKASSFRNRRFGRLVAFQTLFQEEMNPGSSREYGEEFMCSELNQLYTDFGKKGGTLAGPRDDSVDSSPSGSSASMESTSSEEMEALLAETFSETLRESQQSSERSKNKWKAEPMVYQELLELVQFTRNLIEGTRFYQDDVDRKIEEVSQHWKIPRMATTDRTILRMAAYEMIYMKTPKVVVISEALELGNQFGSKDSVKFLNGILDRIEGGA